MSKTGDRDYYVIVRATKLMERGLSSEEAGKQAEDEALRIYGPRKVETR